MRRGFKNPSGPNLSFWAVFILVTVLLLSGALWVLSFVRGTAVSAAEDEVILNQAYINYSTAGSYVSSESTQAVQAYIAEFPEPQNAQVLTGMTTSEIWGFMTAYVAGGLQVDCTYCHNINNFAADGAEIGVQFNHINNPCWAGLNLLIDGEAAQNIQGRLKRFFCMLSDGLCLLLQ